MMLVPWKKFLGRICNFLVRAEKFSATPHPEDPFSGVPEIRPKSIFGRKSGFSPFCKPDVRKRGGYTKSIFQKYFSSEYLHTNDTLEIFWPFWVKSWYFYKFRGFRNFGRRKCGFGVAENFSARAKNIQKVSPKNFHVYWTLWINWVFQ